VKRNAVLIGAVVGSIVFALVLVYLRWIGWIEFDWGGFTGSALTLAGAYALTRMQLDAERKRHGRAQALQDYRELSDLRARLHEFALTYTTALRALKKTIPDPNLLVQPACLSLIQALDAVPVANFSASVILNCPRSQTAWDAWCPSVSALIPIASAVHSQADAQLRKTVRENAEKLDEAEKLLAAVFVAFDKDLERILRESASS
jgi:hypothetical protein